MMSCRTLVHILWGLLCGILFGPQPVSFWWESGYGPRFSIWWPCFNLMMQLLHWLCGNSLGCLLGLLLKFACSLLVLFTNFIEFLHVLKEVWSSLQSDEKLGLFAVAAVVGGLYCDGLCSNLLERGIVVPDEVLWGNDAGGDCVAKGMQLNSLMRLQVLLTKEYVEIGVLLDWHVDLVGVFWANSGSSSASCLIFNTFFHHCTL